MRQIFAFFLTTLLIFSPLTVSAKERAVVVELYTSQGCSSCPPADELLTELAQRDDVIPLALHVDYWDYLGWKDIFGAPAHTDRQRAYARAANKRTIYTPQIIIQGEEDVIGNRRQDVQEMIARYVAGTDPIELLAELNNGRLVVTMAALESGIGPAVIQIVRYIPQEVVKIRRGENAGRKIIYSNIVVDWDVVGRWDGTGDFTLKTEIRGTEPLVVIVQKENNGPILAAYRLR